MILLVLLTIPLAASLILAIIGDRKYAPEVNILCSAAACAASVALGVKVYDEWPLLAWNKKTCYPTKSLLRRHF